MAKKFNFGELRVGDIVPIHMQYPLRRSLVGAARVVEHVDDWSERTIVLQPLPGGEPQEWLFNSWGEGFPRRSSPWLDHPEIDLSRCQRDDLGHWQPDLSTTAWERFLGELAARFLEADD